MADSDRAGPVRPSTAQSVLSGMTFSELNALPSRALEERAAAGRDVGHLVGQAELLDGLGRLAAADGRDGRGVGHRLGDA